MGLPVPLFVRRLLRPAWERLHWERVWRSRSEPYWLVEEPRPPVIAAAREGWLPRESDLLEIGCGTAGNAAWLAREGWRVLATDIAPSAIERARARHGGIPGLEFAVLDACGPDLLQRTFPAILDSGCLHIVPRELHPAYQRNVLGWSEPGTRFLLRIGEELYERPKAEALARSLFADDFDFESVSLAPRTSRPGENRRSIVFRLTRRGAGAPIADRGEAHAGSAPTSSRRSSGHGAETSTAAPVEGCRNAIRSAWSACRGNSARERRSTASRTLS